MPIVFNFLLFQMVSDGKCLKKNKVKVRCQIKLIKMLLPLKFNISCV